MLGLSMCPDPVLATPHESGKRKWWKSVECSIVTIESYIVLSPCMFSAIFFKNICDAHRHKSMNSLFRVFFSLAESRSVNKSQSVDNNK